MNPSLRIATRKSPLALWQTEWVAKLLQKAHPGLSIKIIHLKTEGDQTSPSAFPKKGVKGLFTKELEEALLSNRANIAVHSVKDMSAELPSGLILAAVCQREDPRDAYVSLQFPSFEKCPLKTRIGTGSLRRQCQLKSQRPDLILLPLRGNVGSRLQKLSKGEYDAVLLALAGLKRLNIDGGYHIQPLSIDTVLPAPGQGAIGIECRSEDAHTQMLLKPLNDLESYCSVIAERTMSQQLGGNCQVPVAGLAFLKANQFCLKGLVGSPDGKTILRSEKKIKIMEKPTSELAFKLGSEVAGDLLKQGARALLCLSSKIKPSG